MRRPFAFGPIGAVLCAAVAIGHAANAAAEPDARATPPPPQLTTGFEPWWATVGGGVAWFAQQANAYYNAFVAFDHLLGYGIELALELGGWFFDQQGADAGGASFNVDTHWHFVHGPRWSLYFEGGAGLLVTSEDIPPGGLSFNFTPRAGFAVTWRPANARARIRAGARWQHISNAAIRGMDSNPGADALMLHAGVTFPL